VKSRAFAIVAVMAALCSAILVGVAQARNEHCAGGIQYVVGGMRDKDKGNTEDFLSQMHKAIQQFEMCADGDPADFEAMGYMGWAYCELDEAGALDGAALAGGAFKKCLEGLTAKGDKKLKQWQDNRQGYWVRYYNKGITAMKDAGDLYPEMGLKPKSQDPGEVDLFNRARGKYADAVRFFTKATQLKPEDPIAYLSMGQAYQFIAQFDSAEVVFKAGLAVAPGDTNLVASMVNLHKNIANKLIADKKYDEAITYYNELLKAEPDSPDLLLGVADAYFNKAQTPGVSDTDKKAYFKSAAEAWAKAGAARASDFDLAYNSGVAFQNAGLPALAEAQFRRALQINPADADVPRALSKSLIEQGKFDEAVGIVFTLLKKDPKKPEYHQLLSAAYDKGGNKSKSTEEAMVFLALRSGTAVPGLDAAIAAATAPAEANTIKAFGKPDQIFEWKADLDTYRTWVYWTKGLAFHFKAGNLVMKSDWSAPATASGAPKK
jgi:tetratricopeptide (TPR) repeat protein